MSAPSILIAAGEASGDMHGAALVRALRRRLPGVRLWGLGGPRMSSEGVELLAGLDRLAVMGFAEVARHLPYFFFLMRRLRRELVERRPDLIILIDYPGLNMRLARAARAVGVPVLYYVAPQVWAWKRRRARDLARTADRVAVILPFEPDVLRSAGVRAEFVGHPLMEERARPLGREEFCADLGLDPGRPLLAIFPGSRRQEVSRHLETFAMAATMAAADSDAQTVVAQAAGVDDSQFEPADAPRTRDAWTLLSHARAALIKSGTGTLQAAIAGTPMVVAYRTSAATFALARRLVRVPHVSLVNLIADSEVVPEFLQERADPATLADALRALLRDGPTRSDMLAGLALVRASLAAPGPLTPSERVAEMAAELLQAAASS
ncbi:MAG: lipid-A-disaccharide synthase [Gemmatimonadota bacterium]